ncbi:MAG: peptidylprolyl isomerase, partial [Candidatus Nephrothrix sp. EaCA]
KLKIAEALGNGLDTTAAFRKEFANYREELRRPYSANKNIMDKLTQEAYDRLKWEVNAAHILIRVMPDAAPKDTLNAYNTIASVRDKLLNGGDFQALAREFSEDPSAKQNSGNLGYFSALQMVYPFEKA